MHCISCKSEQINEALLDCSAANVRGALAFVSGTSPLAWKNYTRDGEKNRVGPIDQELDDQPHHPLQWQPCVDVSCRTNARPTSRPRAALSEALQGFQVRHQRLPYSSPSKNSRIFLASKTRQTQFSSLVWLYIWSISKTTAQKTTSLLLTVCNQDFKNP